MKAATIRTAIYLAIILAGWVYVQHRDDQAQQTAPQVRRISSIERAMGGLKLQAKCAPVDYKKRPLTSSVIMTADRQLPRVHCGYAKNAT